MMKTKFYIVASLFFVTITMVDAQKKMTLETYDIWNSISNVNISNNGDWISYNIKPGKGDETLVLYNTRNLKEYKFPRSHSAKFDYDNNFISFKTSIPYDSLQVMKKRKVKKKKMPKDTISVFSLTAFQTDKISDIQQIKIPNKYGGYVAMKLIDKKIKKDSTLVKDQNSENGNTLLVHDTANDTIFNFPYVKEFYWVEKNKKLIIHSTGIDSTNENQISLFDFNNLRSTNIYKQKGKYFKITASEDGEHLAFLLDQDTTKAKVRPYDLFLWNEGDLHARKIADNKTSIIPKGWEITKNGSTQFSENNSRLYFGISPIPLQKDTTILEDDMANVEIWNYKDPLLYTQQNVRSKREKERNYKVMYDIEKKKFIQLSDIQNSEISYNKKSKSEYILSYDEKPYQQNITHLGYAFKDLYLLNLKTSVKKRIATKIQGSPRVSPSEQYIYWYSRPDTAWHCYDIKKGLDKKITQNGFYDEMNDRPMHPGPSGFTKWTDDDKSMLINDHFDIWEIDPQGQSKPVNLTNGRSTNLRYRLINLDREVDAFPSDTSILLKVFNDIDKSSGYAYLNLKDNTIQGAETGPYSYTTRVIKAKHSNDIIYTKEDFQTFPNLIHSNTNFENPKVISDANPQQEDYDWGTIELVEWKDYNGVNVRGLLVKPDNFDPKKKYPMMVNFYERSTDRLKSHRAPNPGRSTINYSYWANKGYLIFNPDVKYKNGYPGQSCYDAVISGVEAMIDKGFVKKDKIGVQGHSWGGYQIAHLLTKTDIFACAEAGAPVVNMVSAYGGIRWGSGMSRMFQYEKTQSRLGGTLWEKPELYIENSPIFNLDKVNTPVLILHNDNDGAVPWYQGIEYFVGLRRLGKPTWMLNYNEEPHWPVKRPNRVDFNLRLEQFFDHYLMDAPIPKWMDEGVPAINKGLDYGFDLKEEP